MEKLKRFDVIVKGKVVGRRLSFKTAIRLGTSIIRKTLMKGLPGKMAGIVTRVSK